MIGMTLLAASLFSLISSCSGQAQSNNTSRNAAAFVSANDTCRMIDQYLSELEKSKNFSGGLLIIKNGKKLFSKGYGLADKEKHIPFTPSTLASVGSITKAFTAAAIMKLAEQGKLSVADQLEKFFPAVPADKAGISIHQLLTHSSGFHEFLENDGGDYEKIEKDEFLRRAFAEPLAFKPGEKAVYTNVGMSILAVIVEQVSGVDYETSLRRELFAPVGIKDIGYHYPPSSADIIAHGYQNGKDWGTHQQHFADVGGGPYWNLKGNGGLEASLDDMFRWANAFTDHTVLNDTTIRRMFTPHIVEDGTNGHYSFGYGCNISKSGRNTTVIDNGGSNGIYFARLIRLPQEGLVFYMVTNESSINTNMVLPNVTQLYFEGKIAQDAVAMKPRFETAAAEKIYTILVERKPSNLEEELKKAGIRIDDDMILLDVGRKLIQENKPDEALALYQYYTMRFPRIIVAWNDLGDVYLLKNNKTEAIKCYQQALKLRPDNPRAKRSLESLMK